MNAALIRPEFAKPRNISKHHTNSFDSMCHSLVTCCHETYQAWSYRTSCSQTWSARKAPILPPFSSTSSNQTLQLVRALPFIREVLFIYDSRIKINIVIFQPAKLNYQRVAFQFFDVGTVRLTLHEQIERPELTDLAFQQRGSMENKHSQSFYHFWGIVLPVNLFI